MYLSLVFKTSCHDDLWCQVYVDLPAQITACIDHLAGMVVALCASVAIRSKMSVVFQFRKLNVMHVVLLKSEV